MTDKAVKLQAVGWIKAKAANDFQVGEKMGWNFGSITEVTARLSETDSFVTFQLRDKQGKLWERRLKKSRLVAIVL